MKKVIVDMQTTDAKRSQEIDSLLSQLDSTMKTLANTRDQISHIPNMVASVVRTGVVPDLEVPEDSSIAQRTSIVLERLIESLWERGER